MSLGPLYVLLKEMPVQVLCPFFIWFVYLPGVELCEFFMYFGDQALVWGIIGKYVFPYCLLSFYFNALFFSHAEAFYFDEIPIVYSFMSLVLGDMSVRMLLRGMSEIFLWMFSSRTFMVLQSIFKSFIHHEFIFVYGVSGWSSLNFFACSCPDLPTPFVEEAIFAPFYAPASFVKY